MGAMTKRRIQGLVLLAVFAATAAVYAAAQFNPAPASRSPAEVAAQISTGRYLTDITYLASDALKGRGNGTPELDQAAEYIAALFKQAGLVPMGDNGTYFQNFEVTTGAELGPKNELEIAGKSLKIDEDFVPIVFSDTAEFEGPLIFAGYGITAPEYMYDDYSGIDATGKIVVVFQHEPQELDAKSVFAGTDFTRHASYINKAINARMHGAKGIVFITDPSHDYEDVGPATRREQSSDMGIPAVHAKRAAIEAAFKTGGQDLKTLHDQIDKDLKPRSFELPNITARIATDVVRSRKTVRNVLAAYPGTDPALKDQWIVVGAHYDHLGLGDASSLAPSQIGQPHHGADDNASGTAGVMELARLASSNRPRWGRSVLFMAFAGEEIGLLGSSYFANHPTVRLENIDAMLNMDMIGRLKDDNRIFIGGIGTSPSLKADLEEANKAAGLSLEFSDSGYGASDHTSFNAKKIPVLFFFSGLHTDYHKPSDTADKINAAGAAKVLTLVYLTVDKLAGETDKLAYTEVKNPTPAGRGSGGGYGPYFGSVPDFRDDVKGVLFSDVQNNSPAAKAGLKGGDLMVAFDGKPMLTLNDFVFVLRQKKPGDVVAVVVKRNGEDVRVNVTLEARR
jgi:Zn-dependent M28 family amino/carboxypeptidase